MKVEVSTKPSLTKIDHLFVLIKEGDQKRSLPDHAGVADSVADLVKRAAFTGRSDESITLLTESPKKTTLIGLGKRKPTSARNVRKALYSMARIARRGRDKNIAVVFPYDLDGLSQEKSTRLILDLLAHSDYRYDAYLTKREDDEPKISVTATLIAPSSLGDK